jgi:hypothetical protein
MNKKLPLSKKFLPNLIQKVMGQFIQKYFLKVIIDTTNTFEIFL